MELEIKKANGELKGLTLRKENNGEDRVLAVDLKIVANIRADDLKPLFIDTPELLDTLFDSGGNVLNPVIEFVYRVSIENIECALDDVGAFKGGRVKKNMKMVPRNGSIFETIMTLQLSDVGDIRMLVRRLHEPVKITIVERQQSLGLQSVA